MAASAGPDIATSGLVLSLDAANQKSFPGEPTVNLVPEANLMTNWGSYVYGNDGTFMTEFGTVGYKMYNRGSWNGIVRGISLPSTGTYTISAYIRYLGGASDNNGGVVYTSGGGISDTASGHSKVIGEWVRVSMTRTYTTTSFTFYLISYGGTYGGSFSSWEVTMPQVELRSTPTAFAIGTRGNTVSTGGGWRDTSGKGSHVELVNGPTSPSGYANTVIAFDGTNDYGTIPTFTSKPTTLITCEAWCKPLKGSVGTGTHRGGVISSTNSMYLGIIDSTDGGSTFSMHWANQTTNSRLYNWNGQIPNNAWSHLVGTYDGSTTRAYLNGVEIFSEPQTGNIPDATYVIGTYGGGLVDGVHNFNGLIGDSRIYNRALTASEVLENFNKTKGKFRTM